MIVVDTNILVYYFIKSVDSELAVQVYDKDPVWIAPFLWRSEFRNTSLLYLRRELLTMAQVMHIIRTAEQMMFSREFLVASADVYRLAAQSNCSAYDCEFVALAQQRRVQLVTADKQILRDFPEMAVSPAKFIQP